MKPYNPPMPSRNIILETDAYKLSHPAMVPHDVTHGWSYLESRGGEFNKTTYFGTAYYTDWLSGPLVTNEVIAEAEDFAGNLFGTKEYFKYAKRGWQKIVDVHGGYLPLKIKAVPEGTRLSTRNILTSVVNTDHDLPWLPAVVESTLLKLAYTTSVASLSNEIKRDIAKWCEYTGTEVSPFHLNDFGFRSATSYESSALGGAAHLVNFMGTDTLSGIRMIKQTYGFEQAGFSVMASEHSVTTMHGKANEVDAFRRFIALAEPELIVSLVIDSYNPRQAADVLLGQMLYSEIMSRPGKTVLRPDSGDPVIESVAILEILWNRFGGTTNRKGFKVLDPHVGVIYGDGINRQSINAILRAVVAAGFCVSNIVFGMGGALHSMVNRDTIKAAFKTASCYLAPTGEWMDVFKEPKTDSGKVSKRGQQKLILLPDGEYVTVPINHPGEDQLIDVFLDGETLNRPAFPDIRERASR